MLVKKLAFFSLASLTVMNNVEAKWFGKACDPSVIKMEHSSGFSLSFKKNKLVEAGNDGFKMDIPVSVDGEDGCFTQKHNYLFGFKKNDDGFKGSVTVKAPEFDYEDVADFHAETYVQIESQSAPFESQIKLTTFVCAGEAVLSVHTFSNKIQDIVKAADLNMNVGIRSVFATGAAATALQRASQPKSLISGDTDDFFVKEYLLRTHFNGRAESLHKKVVSVPSVLLYSKMKTQMVDQSSFYQTHYVNQLGCTNEFANAMSQYNLKKLRDKRVGALSVEADDDGFVASWK